MLLHVLGHIQTDQGVHIVKKVTRQLFDQFRLAHTCRTHKDKRNRSFLGRNSHPIPPDGTGNGVHRFILADNVFFQPVCQALNLLILLGFDF